MSSTKQQSVGLTDTQIEAANEARGTEGFSAYVRRLIAADVGDDWPDDMAQHGGNRLVICCHCGTHNVHVVDGVVVCFDC